MRPIKFALLTVAVVLMLGVLQARADSDSDDLTVCCAQINPPDTTAAMKRVFSPQVLGCKAIDGSPKSISACTGVVLGCAEGSFLCQPDTGNYPGLLDCLCNNRAFITPF